MTRQKTMAPDHAAPTPKELARRRELLDSALRRTAERPLTSGPFPSAEEMLRQDRER